VAIESRMYRAAPTFFTVTFVMMVFTEGDNSLMRKKSAIFLHPIIMHYIRCCFGGVTFHLRALDRHDVER